MAEEEARRRGCYDCVDRIVLNAYFRMGHHPGGFRTRAVSTLHFQAPGFYLKQGWEVAARIDCEPPGHTRFYMTKKLS
jgi:hypothetical protein